MPNNAPSVSPRRAAASFKANDIKNTSLNAVTRHSIRIVSTYYIVIVEQTVPAKPDRNSPCLQYIKSLTTMSET